MFGWGQSWEGLSFHLEQGLIPPGLGFDSFCCEKGIAFEKEGGTCILNMIYTWV